MKIYTRIDKSKIKDDLSKYFNGDYTNDDAVNGLCAFSGAGVKDINYVVSKLTTLPCNNNSTDFSMDAIRVVNYCISTWNFWEEIVSKKHIFGGMTDGEIVKMIVEVTKENNAYMDQKLSAAICNMISSLDGEDCEIDYGNNGDGIKTEVKDGDGERENANGNMDDGTHAGRGKSLTEGNKKRIKAITELPSIGFWNMVQISEIAVNLKYTTSELFTGYSSVARRDKSGNQFVASKIRSEDELAFVSPEDMADPLFLVNLANDDVDVFANALYKKPKQKVFLALDKSGSMNVDHNKVYGLAYLKEFVDRLKADKCELWFGWHGDTFNGFERITKDNADIFFNNALVFGFEDGTNYMASIGKAIREVEKISEADDNSIYEIVYIGDSDDEDIDFEKLKKLVGKCKFNYIHIARTDNNLEGLSELSAFTGGKCIVHSRTQ